MIVLFTDFGLHGPYTGQMKAVLHQMAPGVPVVDLFADAPGGNPKPSAYLLAAYAVWFAAGTGVLGMHRTFILHASGSKLPSDLLGFTCLRGHKHEPVQSTRSTGRSYLRPVHVYRFLIAFDRVHLCRGDRIAICEIRAPLLTNANTCSAPWGGPCSM